jgi:2-polyprenyl-6-methoxyphenol hydroxylase-like FAD-dependent oxidoreductase
MERALVLGGSMGGLLAARALSEYASSVLVVERDELRPRPEPRRGVPQGRHVHALLARGAEVLESLFPGVLEELVAAGAPRSRVLEETRFVYSGHELARADLGVSNIQPTRALLEQRVRERVAALPNVKVMDGHEVTGLVSTDGGRVVGARVARRPGAPGGKVLTAGADRLDADLVVDALGRGGRARTWLSELGYARPAEDRIACDVTYVSRMLRIPDLALSDRLVVVGPVAGRPRAMALSCHEDGRWMLTVGGMAGDRPTADDRGILDFARTMAPPDVFRAIENAEPVTAPVTHRFPASVRRRYERLRRFPPGLLVFGDAICSFNPIYGQGMTVAALEAEALRGCLRAGDRDLARRFFRAAARVIDGPWRLAAMGDLSIPEVPGPRPPRVRLLNRYVARLHRAAHGDPELAAVFLQVTGLIAPPSALVRPRIVVRALTVGKTGEREHPAARRG